MASELPPFAKQWALQWKRAAPALQAIRDAELRQLGIDEKSRAMDGASSGSGVPQLYDRYPERHGMVIMQGWLMRHALLLKRLGDGTLSKE